MMPTWFSFPKMPQARPSPVFWMMGSSEYLGLLYMLKLAYHLPEKWRWGLGLQWLFHHMYSRCPCSG